MIDELTNKIMVRLNWWMDGRTDGWADLDYFILYDPQWSFFLKHEWTSIKSQNLEIHSLSKTMSSGPKTPKRVISVILVWSLLDDYVLDWLMIYKQSSFFIKRNMSTDGKKKNDSGILFIISLAKLLCCRSTESCNGSLLLLPKAKRRNVTFMLTFYQPNN